VVLNRLDHDLVLLLRACDLHPSGTTNCGVRNITVTSNLIAGVNHHNPALEVIGEDPGNLPECGGLSDTRASHQQQGLTVIQQIANHGHRSKHGPANPTGQANDCTLAVANGTDTMKSALDPSAVVRPETTETRHHTIEVLTAEGGVAK
tara:strand:+ start:277 stop:723 length:447 start_codon:yes stop_codon:yes gene_type:complete